MSLMKLVHLLPPETAHALGIFALSRGLIPPARFTPDPCLRVEAFGLSFTHPLGLAAGFDKNAVAVNALLAQGFAFVETGTVTPRPQAGNPKPRVFRLREDEAVINRLGFNNDGLDAFLKNFTRRDKNLGIAGANIGKNKDSGDAIADYVEGIETLTPHADYITVNISSPNTQGLRDLQKGEALDALLGALTQVNKHHTPLLVKLAPDLSMEEKETIARLALAHRVDGLIVSNTTVSRPELLRSRNKNEAGGLSGRPLFELSTRTLSDFYRLTQGKIPLIGAGGVASAKDAYEKIRAGASLVQLYTALVYQGFGLAARIAEELPALLKRDGFTAISQAVGSKTPL